MVKIRLVEDILYKELLEITKDSLAKKDGIPAVFYGEAPSDTDSWKNEEQYPRLTYYIEYKYNPERQTSGTLTIEISQLQEESISSEEIAELIRPKLDDLFVTDDISTVSFNWNRNLAWSTGKEAPLIAGTTMVFDLYDYPFKKLDGGLDPVYSMSLYAKKAIENTLVIGVDKIPDVYRGNLMYIFLSGYNIDVDTSIYAVTWLESRLKGQIVGPNLEENCDKLMKKTAMDLEFILEDTSPFFVNDFKLERGNNDAQLSINGRYGVLRNLNSGAPPLKIINILLENTNYRRIIQSGRSKND